MSIQPNRVIAKIIHQVDQADWPSLCSEAFAEAKAAEEIRASLADAEDAELHWMLESECRRSSVLDLRTGFVADFWGHGAGPSWRRRAGWPI